MICLCFSYMMCLFVFLRNDLFDFVFLRDDLFVCVFGDDLFVCVSQI